MFCSGKVDEKATQLHAIASLKVLLDATKPQDGVNGTADGVHSAEAADSGRATGSEVGVLSSLYSEVQFRRKFDITRYLTASFGAR